MAHRRASRCYRIGGKAKAMVVTASRELAVRTYFAIKKYVEDNGYDDCRPLVAFSDSVRVDGEDYTETQLNGFGEAELPKRFTTKDWVSGRLSGWWRSSPA